ncbi:MAG TPA: anhydro-N-acetylmuramic acid kinase [Stellaceae bacterium]
MTAAVRRVIGLMSGTSLDGIDAAYVETDGRGHVVPGPAITVPYDDAFRARLRGVLGGVGPVAAVERELTERHAEVVRLLRERHGIDAVDVIGFHGHTILHRPEERRTWQIGDGALLARLAGATVVCDFRSADVAAGGEGAPLVPIYHAALAARGERPVAILNIGGVANVTWIGPGEDELLAFDTGPGNAPIDDWVMTHAGERFDRGGALARTGRVDRDRLDRFLAYPFFAAPPPKSLDRDAFAGHRPDGLAPADGAATLTAMSAAAVAQAASWFPLPARRWLVAGGGRHNAVLMDAIRERLGGSVPVEPIDAAGWDGDALEAQAFAYLAVRVLDGLPTSFPTTTRAPRPTCGGKVFEA